MTDDAGATGVATSTATIGLGNQPPVADANGQYSGTVGVPVTFDGTGSKDPDGSIATYSWDFGDGATGSGATPIHTYAAANMYNVTLTVTDDSGASDAAGSTVEVTAAPVNQTPVADANGPYSGTVGVPVTFDGTGSNDPDGSIVAYSWDFGDGMTGSGATPTHSYTADGNYVVTLTVTDDAGDSGTDTSTVSIGAVGNEPPISDPSGPYSGTVGVAVAFDGTGSTDPDGTITSYEWDFGDGSTGGTATPTHTYAADGNYTVTLTVTDDAGASGAATTTASIGVGNRPPVSDPNGPYSGTIGVAVAFDGTDSYDPDGSIAAYSWDFGDGTTGSGATPSHSYTVAGIYHVTLEVTDDAGAMVSAMTTATIAPDGTRADVVLTGLKTPNNVQVGMGNTASRVVNAQGDGTAIAQEATVSLSVLAPAGVSARIDPASLTRLVSPKGGATKFRFKADISCDAPGNYMLEWTATIAAEQNSDVGNDTLTDTTSVRCGKPGDDGKDDEDKEHDGEEHRDQ